MKHFDVAAGILVDNAGRVLITERLCDGPFKGLWEFPGGKLRAGEAATAALVRELAEEIDIEVTQCSSFMHLRHEYDDRTVTIEFFLVRNWNRDPIGREGQRLRWVCRDALDAAELLPADVPVVEALKKFGSWP